LAMFYQDWNMNSYFPAKFANEIEHKGAVPVITWEPWDQANPSTQTDPLSDQIYNEILTHKHDNHIRQWAKDAALYGKPVFLRFAHEMNGNWYPWGNIQPNSQAKYIVTWRYIHNIFEEEGADNVTWVWAPNSTDANGDVESLLNFYPGTDYVDWVGFSAFNWGTASQYSSWKPFKSMIDHPYAVLVELNKPIMISETSSVSVGGNKAEWFTNALEYDLTDFPEIKAIVFYNHMHNQINFQLNDNMDAQSIFTQHIVYNSYFVSSPIITNIEENNFDSYENN